MNRGFMFAVISFSVPLVSIFFNMGCSCLALKAWVVLLDEFPQYKYSILSYELFLQLVPQLTASLHVLAPSPTVSCLLLCISTIFATGFSLSLSLYPVSWLWRPCVPWLWGYGFNSSTRFHDSPTLSYIDVHFDGSFLSFS